MSGGGAAVAARGLGDAVRAEWVKARSAAGVWWLLAGIVAAGPAIGAVACAAVRYHPGGGQDPVRIGLAGVQGAQLLVAGLAVAVVGGEYGSGMIRTSLAAVPRRGVLLAAKALVVGVLVLVAAAGSVLGAVFAARAGLPGGGFTAAHGFAPLSLADGPTARAAAGSVLYLVLVALLALGAAFAVREAAAAIGLVLALFYLLPILAGVVGSETWRRRLHRYGPTDAGLAVQSTLHLDRLPIGPWPGLAVLACWTAAGLLAGWALLRCRDA